MLENLGFWVAIFQPDPIRDRVKVWFDGSEDYQFFTIDDFVLLGTQFNLTSLLRQACREYSFFLWRVEERQITRIGFKDSAESLRKELVNVQHPFEETSIADRYSKTDIDVVDEKNVKIKI